jgi:hypothetical protein
VEQFTVSIDDCTGESKFLVNELSSFLLESGSTIKRASHVEPVSIPLRLLFYVLRYLFGEYGKVASFTRFWSVQWRVNLSPVNGPILPTVFDDRDKAIEAEIVWLETNFL